MRGRNRQVQDKMADRLPWIHEDSVLEQMLAQFPYPDKQHRYGNSICDICRHLVAGRWDW